MSQRGPGVGQPGRWEFPGGKRERGERDADALAREIREELGVEVDVGPLIWTARAGPLELRFFRCGWLEAQRPRPLGQRPVPLGAPRRICPRCRSLPRTPGWSARSRRDGSRTGSGPADLAGDGRLRPDLGGVMAKAKRQRRNSIRTMSADSSALEALESLERAERSASESGAEANEGENPTTTVAEAEPE